MIRSNWRACGGRKMGATSSARTATGATAGGSWARETRTTRRRSRTSPTVRVERQLQSRAFSLLSVSVLVPSVKADRCSPPHCRTFSLQGHLKNHPAAHATRVSFSFVSSTCLCVCVTVLVTVWACVCVSVRAFACACICSVLLLLCVTVCPCLWFCLCMCECLLFPVRPL